MKLIIIFSIFLTHLSFASVSIYPYGEKPLNFRKITTQSAIDLSMAKNEFEFFIAKVDNIAQDKFLNPISQLELKFDQGDPGVVIHPYIMGSHQLSKSSFSSSLNPEEVLDIAIPNHLVSDKKFKISHHNVPKFCSILFEFFTPPTSKSGSYTGNISFKIHGQNFTIPFKLKIFKSVLPGRFDLKTSFGFAPWTVLKKHYGDWNENEFELYQKYFDLATEHRIDLHKIFLKFPKVLKQKGFDLLKQDENPKYTFYDYWMSLYKGLNSSLGFKWSVTDLPVPEEMKVNHNETANNFWSHLNKSVVTNNLKESTFVYFSDEPKKEGLPKLKEHLTQIKKHAPDLNFLITFPYAPTLDGLINWWCVNYTQWDKPPFPRADYYKNKFQNNKNAEFWLYSSCNSHGCDGPEFHHEPDWVIDRPSGFLRIFPWLAEFYGAKGILYYDTVYGYQFDKHSPWTDHFQFHGYGEGNLFYPCNKEICGTDQEVIPSLRLKIFRDGLEDIQLLKMAKVKNKLLVESKLNALIKDARHFSTENMIMNQYKKEILETLDK